MPLIRANGTELNYDLSGPTGAPILALSNALGTTLAMWDGVAGHLRGRYRILRYDTRGHGVSPTRDAETRIEDLANDLIGLLDALGIEKAHLAGLSLGGMTVQAVAAMAPERVLTLSLLATAAHLPSRESWRERAATVRDQGTVAIVAATLGRWFTEGFREAASSSLTRTKEDFTACDRTGYARACEAIGDMDLRPVIGRIQAPTLVIAGREDPATPPSMAEEMCANIPQAELVLMPRAAHLLAVEHPAVTAAHLGAFLDRHRGAVAATGAVGFAAGLENRKAVLGPAHVERSLAGAGPFDGAWQDFITRTAWGEIWGDPRLPWKTRSIVTLALMIALGREEEFKLHIRPALANGVDRDELQALLLHTAIYAGIPAANGAFRWVRDTLGVEGSGEPGA
jgi:3-oxoadipate enol-lactonase / 4-carboxymuconolactone decarboxylase